ncbi:MAG: hypothetical protein AAGD01_06545 [Acidobacteriota bacterium]
MSAPSLSSLPLKTALVFALLAILAVPIPGGAQSVQYNAPGDVNIEQTVGHEGLRQDMDNARWRLGGLRVDPSIYLNGLSYVNDVFPSSDAEEVSDITARVGAGLRAYLPLGRKAILMGWALPEYVWWADTTERRRWNEFFGAGLFGDFNRLDLELVVNRKEEERIPNAELLQEVPLRKDRVYGNTEIEVFNGISVIAQAQEEETRYLIDELDDSRAAAFGGLDRDESLLRGGVRFNLGQWWTATAGYERIEVDFLDDSRPLSHSGSSPFLTLLRKRGDSEVRLELVQRQVDPETGSRFVPFDETLGFATVSFKPRPRLTTRFYASRNLVFSISDDYVYFLDERVGVGLSWELGRRTNLELFAESGDQDYTRLNLLAPERIDDFNGWGAQVEFDLRESTTVALGVVKTEVDSVIPGQQQDVTRINTSIRIGGGKWP